MLFNTLNAQEPSASTPADALKTIESERGGRHWIDEQTDPPKSPEDSLAAMQIEQGYRIELVAAEPLVRDPVAITFDRRGRMFVAEFSDYPIGPADGQPPLSRIVLLEDTDRDGTPDRRVVFADKLDFANSLMAYQDGLLVGAKTKILFIKDSDGDNIADIRETLFDGFTPAHPQMQISNPRWGIDNRIYFNYGPGKVVSNRDPDHPISLPRKDFWFDPQSMEFGADSGLGQYGNTIDRWGNRFYCLNRNPIITTFLSPEVLARNPYHIVSKSFYDVGKAGGATRVYPLMPMKSNYLSHAGTHTAACGTTAYLGDLGDEDFRSSVFVCEPIGHLVTRSIVAPAGVQLKAERAEPKRDFLASTDSWFRPSSMANGPDGSLYLADMYRLWVEHPKFLPPEIAARLDWRAGEDRGRIYRIVPMGAKQRMFQPPESIEDSVGLLTDSNVWRQSLGQRLLIQAKSREAAPAVAMLFGHKNATTRLHALWTLHGLASLQPKHVITALGDPDPHVRIAGLRLSEAWMNQPDQPAVFLAASKVVNDPDTQVRFQLALSLAANATPAATELLIALARQDGHDQSFADGLLTSTKERSGAILASVIAEQPDNERYSELVRRLAAIVGARGDVNELGDLLHLIAAVDSNSNETDWWRVAAISGLGQGLPRHRGELGRLTLATLITKPPAALADSVASLQLALEQCQSVATDPHVAVARRTAAIELLAYQPLVSVTDTFRTLLSSDQPGAVQAAAIHAISTRPSKPSAEIVLASWDQLRPAVREQALNLLMRRLDTTQLALAAMADGKMNGSGLSIDQRVLLLKHSDASIRQQATKLFGGAISANRRKVVDEFAMALSKQGSAADGKSVFTRICATCHRRDGEGHEVGPDLSDVRNRSKSTLMYEILDPNAKVEPRFSSYAVLTLDGQLFNGLLTTETADAVVLTLPGGTQQTIGRAEIEQIKVSEVSLMPEGIEKDVTPDQMADLLAFLKDEQGVKD